MDPEEERVLYLTRVGREKIFKYGTYNMTSERAITQDHPFYAKRDDIPAQPSELGAGLFEPISETPSAPSAPPAPPEPEDADAIASQIISSNFKVGLTQEEVDALLNGI